MYEGREVARGGPRTTLELRAGALVVAKYRLGPAGRTATEGEARWLAAARHPGVVSLRWVALEEGRLETDHAGLATLRTYDPGPAATAGILARVALTVAELHRAGLVHGRLHPEHVVLAGPGRCRPVLCGPAPAGPGPPGQPAADREGLGLLARLARDRALATGALGRHQRQGWDELIHRLDHDPDVTAHQAAQLLAALAGRSGADRHRPGIRRSGIRRSRIRRWW